MKFTKILSLVAAMAVVLCTCLTASAAEQVKVYVTIADGDVKLCYQEVTVTDIDSDGKLTINDALYIAHENNYEGGAAAGYESGDSTYGLSLMKLWGNDNGSYGYCVDNVAIATSLAEEIESGEHIYAYCYTDLTTWSDTYSYFDNTTAITAKQGDSVSLTLLKHAYDDNWNTVSVPAAGAEIYVGTTATGVKTDSEGKATVTLNTSGKVLISAKSESDLLVPAVCVAEVEAKVTASEPKADDQTKSPSTGDNVAYIALIASVSVILAVISVKHIYEK